MTLEKTENEKVDLGLCTLGILLCTIGFWVASDFSLGYKFFFTGMILMSPYCLRRFAEKLFGPETPDSASLTPIKHTQNNSNDDDTDEIPRKHLSGTFQKRQE